MPTVPTDRDAGRVLPPDAVPLVLGALDRAFELLKSTQNLVATYSRLYAEHVEPHFPDGDDCPEGRRIEEASGLAIIGDLLAETAEVITTRMGGTGSRGLTADQYRAEVAKVTVVAPETALCAPLSAPEAPSPLSGRPEVLRPGQRAARPGELCSCGAPAVVVYETARFGDVPHCGHER